MTLSGLSVEIISGLSEVSALMSLAGLGTEPDGQVCPSRCVTGSTVYLLLFPLEI